MPIIIRLSGRKSYSTFCISQIPTDVLLQDVFEFFYVYNVMDAENLYKIYCFTARAPSTIFPLTIQRVGIKVI